MDGRTELILLNYRYAGKRYVYDMQAYKNAWALMNAKMPKQSIPHWFKQIMNVTKHFKMIQTWLAMSDSVFESQAWKWSRSFRNLNKQTRKLCKKLSIKDKKKDLEYLKKSCVCHRLKTLPQLPHSFSNSPVKVSRLLQLLVTLLEHGGQLIPNLAQPE